MAVGGNLQNTVSQVLLYAINYMHVVCIYMYVFSFSRFAGFLCEVNVNECSSSPCQHQGTCLDGVGRYTCQCVPEWEGPDCQLEVDECRSSPCMYDGQCRDFVGYYMCDCSEGLTGEHIQLSDNEHEHVQFDGLIKCTGQNSNIMGTMVTRRPGNQIARCCVLSSNRYVSSVQV